MARKSAVTLLSEITALLSLSGTLHNVEQLRDLLISAFSNLLGSIYYSEITSFLGETNSITSIATVTVGAKTMIMVKIGGRKHDYILTAGTAPTELSPYIIIPADYNADTNAKYWVKSNCFFKTIDDKDLTLNAYVLKHDLGFMYPNVIVFDATNQIITQVVIGNLSGEDNCTIQAKDVNNVSVTFAGHITGIYKILVTI